MRYARLQEFKRVRAALLAEGKGARKTAGKQPAAAKPLKK
jgi:hypothetical protein